MLCDDNLPEDAQPETGYNHDILLSCIELTDMTTPATAPPHARSRPAHDSLSRAPRPVHPVPSRSRLRLRSRSRSQLARGPAAHSPTTSSRPATAFPVDTETPRRYYLLETQ
jgi:hypothetical protein